MALAAAALLSTGCGREDREPAGRAAIGPPGEGPARAAGPGWAAGPPAWAALRPGEGEAIALLPGGARLVPLAEARAAGLLVVDLGDTWAPFIFSESDGDDPAAPAKPNAYRQTFVALANDRVDPQALFLAGGATRAIDLSPEAEEQRRREALDRQRGKRPPPPRPPPARPRSEPVRNHLEVFGIPPTLSVLLRRLERDAAAAPCYAALDGAGLRALPETVTYQNARQARREQEALAEDATWLAARLDALADAGTDTAAATPPPIGPPLPDAGPVDWAALQRAPPAPALIDRLRANAADAARLERLVRGQARARAIRAAQARLTCEGLLPARRDTPAGLFDLATHEALAAWERRNDIYGWGFLGEQTQQWLQRPPLDLHHETFRRILTERVADAAGIIEDGTAGSRSHPARYRDASGALVPVPDLVGEHLQALLAALALTTAGEATRRPDATAPQAMALFLRTFGAAGLAHLKVAFAPPPRPPYHGPHMDLSVEIDRGDVWYDFPFADDGKPLEQRRERYPTLTLHTTWNGQRIPLARWRTTIGSWRSELHPDGAVYYRYKSSDVGPRVWKQIVAAPVWVPPDTTPARELLTRKIFDVRTGPVEVVDTEVIGPGFQSAYGLVMAIHHQVTASGGLFDNQIRTHGSVDYTSIARRFSHGCHRLVNPRAVRLFGFVLRHRTHLRQGDNPLAIKKIFTLEDRRYGYQLTTRGYYYELAPPLPVDVLEGRVLGTLKKPVTSYVRKPGVAYPDSPDDPGNLDAPDAPR